MRVSEFITANHDGIIARWAEEAKRASAARGLSRPELLNFVPRYLSWLAGAGDHPASSGRALVEGHLSSRLRQGFDLVAILEEFALLGRCITETWASAPPDQQPPPADLDRLSVELTSASTTVSEMFYEHLLEDEQSEKRYLRQVQEIAREAALDGGLLRPDRLRSVLDLVREAMGAEVAAIMLYEPETERLIVSAASGMEDGELEHYRTRAGLAAFPAPSNRGALAPPEVPTIEPEVIPSLYARGIRALLGVRLAAHLRLAGVMYVGISEERPFRPRELHRMEVLGERLILHLDGARLLADLRDKVDKLQQERALREGFVSVLAHDLRGPLSSARLSAEQLLHDPAEQARRFELARRIRNSIDRTDRMIRDLLDANRIRAGERIPLRLDRCDLGEVVREVAHELDDERRRFRVTGQSSVVGIWSADELRRALWNLLTNAVKYGAPDTPITVDLQGDSEGVTLSVHNEGPAIDPRDWDRIFEPYGRGSPREGGSPRGWGLGLTLVRGAVEAHGGRVRLDSAEGRGTTFVITLPWDARPHQEPTEGVFEGLPGAEAPGHV